MRILKAAAAGIGMAVLTTLPAQASAGGLSGVTWNVVEIDGKAPAGGARATFLIGAEGTASGLAGCNRYSGKSEIDGQSLSLGPMATTRMMCAEPEMKQEQRFLDALAATSRWETDGTSLVLYDSKGDARLRFNAQADEISFKVKLSEGATVDTQTVAYRCGDTGFDVEYINAGTISLAILHMEEGTVVASQVMSGSGVRYAGGQYIWWTKGNDATLQNLFEGDSSPGVSCQGE